MNINLFKYYIAEMYNNAEMHLDSPVFNVDPVYSPSEEIISAYRQYKSREKNIVELGTITLNEGDAGEAPLKVFVSATNHCLLRYTIQRNNRDMEIRPERYDTPEKRKDMMVKDNEDFKWMIRQCAFRIANVWWNKTIGSEFLMYSEQELKQAIVFKIARKSDKDVELRFITFLPQSRFSKTTPNTIMDTKLDIID